MPTSNPLFLRVQLEILRDELAEIAFVLDRRGQPAAVDVAMMVVARLDELRAFQDDDTCPEDDSTHLRMCGSRFGNLIR